MKQLLILSGKGGTGKTTVASAFIKLSNAKAYADCDVDAPNLHLVTKQDSEVIRSDYMGLPKAKIDTEKCIVCDKCRQACKFDAISYKGVYEVDSFACEGCSVCEFVCPVGAISMYEEVAGDLMLYKDEKVFSTAQLRMGNGTSGMLVTEVKKAMKNNSNAEFAIIDGSPGIGCPVIASLSGVDMVLIVTEPSLSGISDMERIIQTAGNFQLNIAVCINKYDTNNTNTEKIISYCQNRKIPFVGKIPFDKQAAIAVNNNQSIVEYDCEASIAIKEVYKKAMEILLK